MLLLWTSAFLLGTSTLNMLHVLPNLLLLYAIVASVMILTLFSKGGIKQVSWLVLGYFLGLLWVTGYATWLLQGQLPEQQVGVTQQVVGTIASIPEQRGKGIRFEFQTEQRKVLLNWYGFHPKLSVGDQWQLNVRLKQPHGEVNPGGFDFEKWLFANRILATGYVVKSRENQKLSDASGFYLIDRLRQAISEKMSELLPDDNMLPFIKALTIGQRSEVANSKWAVLSKTGTNHLLAISGLHIGFIAGLFFLLVRFVWARLGLGELVASPIIAGYAAIFAALFYSALAGFSLPTIRALIMVTVVMVATIIKRKVAIWHSFALALLLVLLLDPLAPLTMSFWLSFSAVFILMYALSGRIYQHKTKKLWRNWLRPQWVIFVGLMPLLFFFFQQSSLVAFVANIIAIPLVGFLVMPISLLAVTLLAIDTSLAQQLLTVASEVMRIIWPILQVLADSPFAVWHLHKVHGVMFIALIAGALLFLAPKRTPGRWLAAVYFLPLFIMSPLKPKEGEYWLTVFDIGQGLATMVQTANHTLVYDTGLPWTDMGRLLNYQEVKSLDMLMISHEDSDHAGGAEKLMAVYPPKQVIRENCQEGLTWEWDGVSFAVIHPKISLNNRNNDSCVLLVDNGNYRTLLPGDIEAKAEQDIITRMPTLYVDVMVAPHHGSNTSSTREFLQVTAPDYVVFATGYLNRYHFPTKKTVAKYQKIVGSEMLNTATQGAIEFKFPLEGELSVAAMRERYQRIWQFTAKK